MNSEKNTLIGFIIHWFLQTLAALMLLSAPLVVTGEPLPGNTYYVAPDGDDSNPGTLESPLQSLEAARQKVRDHKAAFGLETGGIAVILREGTWTRTESFKLISLDGGEPGRPVVWRAYPGETVRIVGSETLDPAWFRPVAPGDPEWSRLDPVAQGKVLKVDLAAHGITDYGALKSRGFGQSATGALELFVDEKPMQLARWPKPGQTEGVQSATDDTLTIYGTTTPDVSGTYSKFSTVDGVNSYIKDELVDGVQYYLWRRTWFNNQILTSSWRLVDNHEGNPSLSKNPYWLLYSSTLGTFTSKMNGAIGNPTTQSASIDSGFVTTSTVPAPDSFTVTGPVADRLSRWTTAPEPWFHGFWWYHWADKRIVATSINPATDTITLSEVPQFGIKPGLPFYAYNLLEELTTPGEYYLERSTGILYYWPDGVIANQDLTVSMIEEPAVSTLNADYLQFENISFGMGRQQLVTVDGGTDVTFDRCRFFGAGMDALHLTGTNHSLKRSEITDVGDSGVRIWGGDRASLTPGNNSVENSEIHNFARWTWTYQPAIRLYGVGHRASHNHLHDAPHMAIQFNGNNHLIEYNEINDVVRFSDDAGAIYAYLHWGYRGNRVNYNYIHDVASRFEGLGVHGLYMDGMLSGVKAFGNYFIDIEGWAMFHNGGRDGIYENNIAVRSGALFSASSVGVTVYSDTPGHANNLLETLYEDGVQYQEEPWLSAYPEVAAIPNDNAIIMDDRFTWRYPEGSVFSRNLSWQNGQFIRGQADTLDTFEEVENNLENTDPHFVNEAVGDLRLRSDSPAFTIPGFVDIPFQEMGIVEPPPGYNGTQLTLINQVINNNDGSAVPADWTLRATGGPTPFSGPGPSVLSNASFQPGSYVLSAVSGWSSYTASAWACDGGSLAGVTITLTRGESATCTITNDDDKPRPIRIA